MKRTGKRLLSAAIVLCLLLATLPVTALAEETKPEWKSVRNETAEEVTEFAEIAEAPTESTETPKTLPEGTTPIVSPSPTPEAEWRSVADTATPPEMFETMETPLSPADAGADAAASPQEIKTGTCGPSLTWAYNSATGQLTISGVGPMNDFAHRYADAPWPSDYTSVIIKEGVTTIGIDAFWNKLCLKSVTLPSTLQSIGAGAFSWSGLTGNLVIPDSVTSIGDGAFLQTRFLMSVKLPDRLTVLKQGTFYNCPNLRRIILPTNLQRIEANAFYCCWNLQNVTIPAGVQLFGAWAFTTSESAGGDGIVMCFLGDPPAAVIERTNTFYSIQPYSTLCYLPGNTRWSSDWKGYQTVELLDMAPVLTMESSWLDGVHLSWTAITGYTTFNIYRGTSPNNLSLYAKAYDMAYTDTAVKNGVTYYYQVKAELGIQSSAAYNSRSNTVSAVGVALGGTTLRVARSVANNVGLTWDAVFGATGYSVYRGTNASNLSWYASSTNPWYTDTGAAAGTTYYYRVMPIIVGNATAYGPHSNTVTVVVPAPSTLGATRLTLSSAVANNVGMTWTAVPGATGYSVYRGTGGALTWYASTANPWFTDSRAAAGTTYSYQVMAYKSGTPAIYGPRSNTITAAIAYTAFPAPVVNLAYAQINHTGLTWNAISGATGYSIYRGTPGAALNWYASSTNPWFVDTATRPGTTYTYQVMAYRSGTPAVYGAKSAVKTATIPAIAAPSVNIVRLTAGNVGITWSGINGATGYSVYRGTSPTNLQWYASTRNPWFSDPDTRPAGSTYYYQVLTYLQTNEGNWYSPKSNAVSVVTR